MEGEPDDQQHGQRQLARLGRLAKPSEKLCSPIPTAIDIPTRKADSAGGWRRFVSAAAIARDRC